MNEATRKFVDSTSWNFPDLGNCIPPDLVPPDKAPFFTPLRKKKIFIYSLAVGVYTYGFWFISDLIKDLLAPLPNCTESSDPELCQIKISSVKDKKFTAIITLAAIPIGALITILARRCLSSRS